MRVPDSNSLPDVQPAEAKPVYQDPNAANGTFGEDGAKALQRGGMELAEASGHIAQAAQRVQTRQDVVARVKDLTGYHQAINNEYQRISTEADMSDPATVRDFAKFSADRMNDVLANHQGSPVSRALLAAQLEDTRSSTMDKVSAGSLVAQKAVIDSHLDGELASNVSAVIEQPGTLPERLQAWKARVDDASPGLGTAKTLEWQRKGDEEITRSVVASFIEKGQFDDAEKILKTPGVETVMSGKVQRSLNAKLISGRAEYFKQQHAGVIKINSISEALGRDLTGPEKLRALGIADPQGAKSLPEKVADLQTVLGPDHPVTPEMVQRMAGAGSDKESSPFSDKDSGVMMSLLPKVQAGTANPQEIAQFQVAATNYTQPHFDQISGQTVPGKTLPAPFQDAVDKAGIKLSTQPDRPTPTPARSGDAKPGPTDDSVSMDIFGNAKNLTGIVPTVARSVAGLPVVGALAPSPQMVQMKTQAELMQNNLATILQDNPRIRSSNSSVERQRIADQLNITGNAMQPGQNLENRLVGVDRFLQEQYNQAQAILKKGPQAGREEFQWARRASDAILSARFHLNVPPTVKASEYAAWAAENPGKPFVTEDGRILMSPAK